MVSRRDELNAYTFARRRTVAAFLQPSPTGSEEGAPRPLRAVVPGLIIGALVVAGFGAWGMFKPKAPAKWYEPGQKVIVGSESTTRYVVLETDGETQLHPVLNLASARLLLDAGQFDVIKIDEDVLDSGRIPHGPTIGIPYAPDRLPSREEAGRVKRWAVCQQPGGSGESVQTATFVLGAREADAVEGQGRLSGGQVLYVRDEEGERHLVDAGGTRYRIAADPRSEEGELLLRTLIAPGDKPQPVTDAWLDTLREGDPIAFPEVPGEIGAEAGVGGLSEKENRVGTVIRAMTGTGRQHYVVLAGEVAPVSAFTARLLLSSPQTAPLDQRNAALDVNAQSFRPLGPEESFYGDRRWPSEEPRQVNATGGAGARDTVCGVLRDVRAKGGTVLSTWAGAEYPHDIPDGGTSTYVTPGSGVLFKQIRGRQSESGSLFLVTDTGLRYAVQANGDSSAGEPGSGAGGDGKNGRDRESAQIRLGYDNVKPVLVPAEWSRFLSKGPRLDTNSARQPQGS
ncbi:type VII secretion protein EccB [Streptomyces albus]|uniref:type VII secretion protein EccB n=1 Tax=Streptomyces albus TaxID=1888 RepID=UPI0004C82D1A|nr:type VII secretion protein EccB [Streptomyces albus]